MNLLDQAFQRAQEVLRMNVTERGFSACSMRHDEDPASNYGSVWARDSAVTLMWSLPLQDAELTECGRRSLETILDAKAPDGPLPNYVDVATGDPEYAGIGNIAGLEGAMWTVANERIPIGKALRTGDVTCKKIGGILGSVNPSLFLRTVGAPRREGIGTACVHGRHDFIHR